MQRAVIASCLCLLACTQQADEPNVSITIDALTLAGVGDAIWDLEVRDAADAVVWQDRVSASAYGDERGSVAYAGPCTPGASTVSLWLVGVYGSTVAAPGAFASGSSANVAATKLEYQSPTATGPIVQSVTCQANADVPVRFDVTVLRPAEQGFFDIAVAFEDVFCSAKLDCDEDLLPGPGGVRDRTVVLAFACAASTDGHETELWLDDVALDCTAPNSGAAFAPDIVLDPSVDAGNACTVGQLAGCDAVLAGDATIDNFLYQIASYRGEPSARPEGPWVSYWNVALGVESGIGACRLRTRGTAFDAGALSDGTIPDNFPYVQWDADLGTCGNEALTFETGPVATHYSDGPVDFDYYYRPSVGAGPFVEAPTTLPPVIAPGATTILTGGTVTFTTSEGEPPFTYSVVSGGGSFAGAIYTAGTSPGTVVVRVRDAFDRTSDATVTVAAPWVQRAGTWPTIMLSAGDFGNGFIMGGSGPEPALLLGNGDVTSTTLAYRAYGNILGNIHNGHRSGANGYYFGQINASLTRTLDGGATFESVFDGWGVPAFIERVGAQLYLKQMTTVDMHISSDGGVTWKKAPNSAQDFLASGNGLLVSGGVNLLETSNDNGVTWTERLPSLSGINMTFAAYNGSSLWVAVGTSGTLYTAPANGVTWTQRTSNAGSSVLREVAFADAVWVAVGSSGTIIRSTNGTTWTAISTTGSQLNGVVKSASTWVAVGDNGVLKTSSDGSSWTSQTTGTSEAIRDVAWSGSRFVAVATGGVILTSTNGTSWSPATSGVTNDLHRIVWDGSAFVVLGRNVTLRSTNGTSWTTIRSQPALDNSQNFTDIDSNPSGTMFVAVGTSGVIVSSTTGAPSSWVLRRSGDSLIFRAVVYANGTWIVGGSNGTILTSTNGTTWTPRTSNTTAIIDRIAWNGSMAVAVGSGGAIVTSPNGIDWTPRTSGVTTELRNVAWDAASHTFIAVGLGGAMRESADGVTWSASPFFPAIGTTDLKGVAHNPTTGKTLVVGNGLVFVR